MAYAQLTQPNCASERDTVEKWGVRAATAIAALSAGSAAAVTIKKTTVVVVVKRKKQIAVGKLLCGALQNFAL